MKLILSLLIMFFLAIGNVYAQSQMNDDLTMGDMVQFMQLQKLNEIYAALKFEREFEGKLEEDSMTGGKLNGKGWRVLNEDEQLIYLIGFFNGIHDASEMGEKRLFDSMTKVFYERLSPGSAFTKDSEKLLDAAFMVYEIIEKQPRGLLALGSYAEIIKNLNEFYVNNLNQKIPVEAVLGKMSFRKLLERQKVPSAQIEEYMKESIDADRKQYSDK